MVLAYNHIQSFFNEKRAKEFAKAVNGDIWSDRDNLNRCTKYYVYWN